MKDNFAFATGGVRALENGLLNRAFLTTLAEAGAEEQRRMLIDRGFTGFEKTSDPDKALAGRMEQVYEELLPYLPDRSVLDVCLLPNDYHNLKVAVKGLVRGGERKDLYRRPALVDPDQLWEPLSAKDWESLPGFLREDAREGYEVLTQTGSGQALDLELDRRCLAAMLAAGQKVGGTTASYAEKFVRCAVLRVALRLSRQEPGDALIRAALLDAPGLDLIALTNAVQSGEGAVKAYIRENCDLPEEAFAGGSAGLEKAMENDLVATLQEVRRVACGADVVVAYYLAREMELKNLRILLTGLKAGQKGADLRERMRDNYA